jgi:hypothetical protein
VCEQSAEHRAVLCFGVSEKPRVGIFRGRSRSPEMRKRPEPFLGEVPLAHTRPYPEPKMEIVVRIEGEKRWSNSVW